MLNGIVWNRTDYLYKNGFDIKYPIKPKQTNTIEYPDYISCSGIRPLLRKKECLGYDAKLHLMVRFQFLRSG